METKNLLPFDLEVALKDPERVVFENGEKPLEWHYFKHCSNPYPIGAIDKNGERKTTSKDGFSILGKGDDPYNLRLLPKTVTLWGNVVKTNLDLEIGHFTYKSREGAIRGRNSKEEYIGEPFSVEVEI